jgi:uncharacterized protein (DUF58 family)
MGARRMMCWRRSCCESLHRSSGVLRRILRRLFQYAPTPRLAAWVACASVAWLIPLPTPWGAVVAITALLVVCAAAAYDVMLHPPAAAVTLHRVVPTQLGSGDDDVVAYTVTSRWPRALRVLLADRIPAALGGDGVHSAALSMSGLGTATSQTPIRGLRRGPSLLGACALRVHGTLGLVDVIRTIDISDAVDVGPSVLQIRKYRLLAVQRRLRDAGMRQIRRRGGGMSFDALREYVPGDDPRHIDWKASGRRGVAQVREYTVEQGQTVILALDAGRLMTQMAGDRARFEYAINSCLVLADVVVQGRDKVGLLVFDDIIRGWVPPATGTAAIRSIRNTLASCDARLVEPDYALAFRTLAQKQRSRALIICLSDVVDVRASRAIVTQTRHAALRHITVFLALRNDQLVAAAQPSVRGDEGEAWRGAAAESLLDARAEALLRMKRVGVQVLDVPPQAMSAALVNRYLSIKARGEL